MSFPDGDTRGFCLVYFGLRTRRFFYMCRCVQILNRFIVLIVRHKIRRIPRLLNTRKPKQSFINSISPRQHICFRRRLLKVGLFNVVNFDLLSSSQPISRGLSHLQLFIPFFYFICYSA